MSAVYDVTRRETFTNLADVWLKEIDMYATVQDCILMLVGNKVDRVRGTGSALSCSAAAELHGCVEMMCANKGCSHAVRNSTAISVEITEQCFLPSWFQGPR